MKVNIQKTKNRFISILGAVAVFVFCLAVPAMAADTNGNEFVDFNDYAEYTFAEDNSSVIVDVSFPSEWNISFVHIPDSDIYRWYYGNEIWIDGADNNWGKLNMHPMGGNMTWPTAVGDQLSGGHFIDLRYIPDSAVLTYEFSVGISTYDVNLDEQIYTRYFYFVDEGGKVIGIERHYFDPEIYSGNYTWSESIEVSSFPDGAVGMIPMFVLRNFTAAFTEVIVELSSFQFVMPMTALEFQNIQNEQLQSTMNRVESALEEQGKQLDDIMSGTPDQQDKADEFDNAVNDAVGELGEAGDVISSITEPTVDVDSLIPNDVLNGTDYLTYVDTLNNFWDNKMILSVVLILGGLIFISYVMFGEKG